MAVLGQWARLALGVAIVAGVSDPVWAQDTAPPSDVTLTGSIGVVSDYRFRGVSMSEGDPAVQGSLEVGHSSGFYAGTWASTLGDARGADVEVDVYAGWTGDAGAATLDIGVLGYLYLGEGDRGYYEIYGSAGWSLGPATATLGVNYAPDRASIGDQDNLYLYGDLEAGVPNTPFTLTAHLGYEDGPFLGSGGEKVDWSLGAKYRWQALTLGVTYVDTDIRRVDAADASVLFSLIASF